MEYRIWIDNPRGFPDTIQKDLQREDAEEAKRTNIAAEDNAVLVEAEDGAAAKWLYDWLEDSVQYYRENYDAATGEIDAARQLADRVYEEVSACR